MEYEKKGDKMSRQKKHKTKPKKRNLRIAQLPDEVIVIPNADKGSWCEEWKPGDSLGRLPHPCKVLALGLCGRGKSNNLKQLFLRHQERKPRKFKRLYIITGSLGTKEWDDCDPDETFDEIPDLSLFDGKEKTCVIIDDFEMVKMNSEQERRLTTLFRMVATHKNCSIYASYQSFFDCCQICRKVSDVFIIYKPKAKNELNTIANRCGIDYDYLRELFMNECSGHYDNVMIDLTKNSPARVRKNIYQPLDYNSDDQD